MSIFIKHVVIQKLKQLSSEELLDFSNEYGFSISEQEAGKIVSYLKTASLNPFDASGRLEMMKELSSITSPEVAKKANQLFLELIRSHGVEHLFK